MNQMKRPMPMVGGMDQMPPSMGQGMPMGNPRQMQMQGAIKRRLGRRKR